MSSERLTIDDVRLIWEDLTCLPLSAQLTALFLSRPEVEALTNYSERVLRRTGERAIDHHPTGQLKLRDWVALTSVSPDVADEVRARAEAEAAARRAAEERRADERRARYEHRNPIVYGPETDYPAGRPIAKRPLG